MELIFNLQKLSGPCMRSVMWNRFSIENFAYRVLPYLPRGENSSLQRNVFKYFLPLRIASSGLVCSKTYGNLWRHFQVVRIAPNKGLYDFTNMNFHEQPTRALIKNHHMIIIMWLDNRTKRLKTACEYTKARCENPSNAINFCKAPGEAKLESAMQICRRGANEGTIRWNSMKIKHRELNVQQNSFADRLINNSIPWQPRVSHVGFAVLFTESMCALLS